MPYMSVRLVGLEGFWHVAARPELDPSATDVALHTDIPY